jgi:hypothetical protein
MLTSYEIYQLSWWIMLFMEKIDAGLLSITLGLGFHWIKFCRNYIHWLICNIDKLGLGLVVLFDKYLIVLDY